MGNSIKSLTKNGKEGFTDIPDITISDTDHLSLRASDLEMKSRKEIELLKEMRKVEGVFPPVERHNQWSHILFFLNMRGVSLNIFKLYEYKGFRLSIIRYLEMRGADEKDGHLIECSRSVQLALDMWCAKNASNLDELYRLAQQVSFRGYKLGVSIHDEAIILSAEVKDGGDKGRKENIAKWQPKAQELANELWEVNSRLSSRAVAEKIKPTLDSLFKKTDIYIPTAGRIRKSIKR